MYNPTSLLETDFSANCNFIKLVSFPTNA